MRNGWRRSRAAAIAVEIYPGAQLYTDREVPTAVASGQIEMGVSSLMRFAGSVPAVDIFTVPFLFDTEARVRAATAPRIAGAPASRRSDGGEGRPPPCGGSPTAFP